MSNILTFKGISLNDLYLLWNVFFQYVCYNIFHIINKLNHLLKAIKKILTLRKAARAYFKEPSGADNIWWFFTNQFNFRWKHLTLKQSAGSMLLAGLNINWLHSSSSSPLNKFASVRKNILLFLYVQKAGLHLNQGRAAELACSQRREISTGPISWSTVSACTVTAVGGGAG